MSVKHVLDLPRVSFRTGGNNWDPRAPNLFAEHPTWQLSAVTTHAGFAVQRIFSRCRRVLPCLDYEAVQAVQQLAVRARAPLAGAVGAFQGHGQPPALPRPCRSRMAAQRPHPAPSTGTWLSPAGAVLAFFFFPPLSQGICRAFVSCQTMRWEIWRKGRQRLD